jgi:hypothetical protein
MRRLWIPYGTTLILGRVVLRFCHFEHGGFGVDDHLVHLGFINRRRLAQETLCHQDERVSLGTLLWFVAGEFLGQPKLLGRLDDVSVLIENLGAGGSQRRVEHGRILRRKPQDKHDRPILFLPSAHRSADAL